MASSRTTVYRHLSTRKISRATASTNNSKTVRVQVMILPAEDSPLLASEVEYEDLPPGCILEHSIGDGAFKDNVFLGVPEAEEASTKINYKLLPSGVREWISTESGIAVSIGGQTAFISSVWIFSTDGGDSTLDPDNFPVRFIGCHYFQEAAVYDLDTRRPIIIDLKLQSLAKVSLESVTIEMLRTYIIDDGDVAGKPNTANRYPRLFDLVYAGPSCVFGWQQNRADNNVHRAWLMPLKYLFSGIAECAAEVFSRYMRTQGAGTNWATSSSAWVGGVRPFEKTITFKKQHHDGARGNGASLAYSDVKYVGLISDVVTPGDMSSSGSNWIGGLLGGSVLADGPVGRGSDTLFDLENCWNLLRALSENACSKTLVRCNRVSGNFELLLEPIRLCDNTDAAPASSLSLTPADFVKSSLKWCPSELVVRSGEVEIPGASGEDHTPVTKSLTTNTDQKPFAITCVVHNLPSVRSYDYDGHYPVGSQDIPEFTTPNVMNQTNGSFNTRVLYYEDTPATIGLQLIALRVSSCVDVTFGTTTGGAGVLTQALGGTYPMPGYIGNASNVAFSATYDLVWRQPLFVMLMDQQRRANMMYAIANTLTRLFGRNYPGFGNPHGTATLKGTFIGSFPASLVGRVYSLIDFDSTTFEDATLWDRDPQQTKVVITKVTPDNLKSTSQIEAVATSNEFFVVPD